MTNLAVANAIERTIYRSEHSKENPYTVISNRLLRDHNIKRADKGLLVELLSWSDKHRICIQALVKKGKEGRDAIQAMLQRLDAAGYIKRTQLKNQDGTFGKVIYQIFENPEQQHIYAIVEDNKPAKTHEENKIQLGFDFSTEPNQEVQKVEEIELTATGKPVNGEPATNNYNKEISNIFNNKPEAEEDHSRRLLDKFYLEMNDPLLRVPLQMAGISAMIQTQKQLNCFLIDFNTNHDQYPKIERSKRIKHFIKFLLKIHHSGTGQKAHLSRLRNMGVLTNPIKKKKPVNARYVNPDQDKLPKPREILIDLPGDISLEGF